MLHIEHSEIKELLLTGNFGLEKESLRVDGTGHLVHTPHPFSDEEHIDRDFCENQTEINTPVVQSAEEAVASVYKYTWQIKDTLRKLPEQEYLWPSSNPPYIRNEVDIPVAQFVGDSAGKTVYREYLSDRYGRYKMTFSGIHVNYSFSDELLEKDFALSGGTDFTEYKNQLYLTLAEQAVAYGWLLVAISGRISSVAWLPSGAVSWAIGTSLHRSLITPISAPMPTASNTMWMRAGFAPPRSCIIRCG